MLFIGKIKHQKEQSSPEVVSTWTSCNNACGSVLDPIQIVPNQTWRISFENRQWPFCATKLDKRDELALCCKLCREHQPLADVETRSMWQIGSQAMHVPADGQAEIDGRSNAFWSCWRGARSWAAGSNELPAAEDGTLEASVLPFLLKTLEEQPPDPTILYHVFIF